MGVDLSNSHPDMDVDQHKRTYDGFVILVKFSVAATAVILIAMAIFLV